MTLKSETIVPTIAAVRNLGRLCKHLAHRVTVERHDDRAHIDFPNGTACDLEVAGDALRMRLEAPDAAALARIQEVLSKHLAQVAAGETLEIRWSGADGAA